MPTLNGTLLPCPHAPKPKCPDDHPIETVQLQTLVRDEEWVGQFNRIEVWRSELSYGGRYRPLTASEWEPAKVPADGGPVPGCVVEGPSVTLTGLCLKLLVDFTDVFIVSFSEEGPSTYYDAAKVICGQGANRFSAYVDHRGQLVIIGSKVGSDAALEIVDGEAISLLGLPVRPPENRSLGKSAHLVLQPGVTQYIFTDLYGRQNYSYKVRYLNTLNHSVSAFTEPFRMDKASRINGSCLVYGYLDMLASDGKPLTNQLVQVYPAKQTNYVLGMLVAGPRQAKYTDAGGHVEFTFVRGVEYYISIAGTDIIRRILAPTDAGVTHFSLLDAAVGLQDDLFTVDRPPLEYAERRTF